MAPHERSHALILHPHDERVFTSDGKHLPSFSTSSLSLDLHEMNCYVQKMLHLPFEIILLRRECSVLIPDSIPHYFLHIFEIPCSAISRATEYETWVPKEKVAQLCVDPSTDLVVTYLRKFAIHGLDINADRLHSFSKRGWFDKTFAWSRSILSTLGMHSIELHQFQSNDGSCLMRLRSRCDTQFYVKSCFPKGIYNEAAVSLVLGTEMPDDFVKPVAVDLERNLMIMKDLGSTIDSTDEYECDAKTEERVITAWGKIQLRTVQKKQQLLGGGVPVWDMETFRSMYEDMFEDAEWWSFQQESMSEEERSKYDRTTCKEMVLARSQDFWSKIEEYQVPFSLVHGDLNHGNVIVREDSRLDFIDLSYTVWSLPFFDLMLTEFEEADEVEFYLELWSDYESMDRLKELYRLTFSFRLFYGFLRLYHMFKYAEHSCREYDRRQGAPILEWFEEQ